MSVFSSLQRKCLMTAILLSAPLLAAAAEPQITVIEGAPIDGQEVTILGKNFTHKNASKPLLYWFADGGTNPSPLGRKTKWDGAFGGELVQKANGIFVAPGSTKSVRIDHSATSGAALGRVSFDSDELYVWRKRLDDFDKKVDFAIRTRYVNLMKLVPGAEIKPGMLMSTTDRKVWGEVISHTSDNATSGNAFYSNKTGNVANSLLTRNIPSGEKLYFYEANDRSLTTPVVEVSLNEGKGIFHTFNHKIFRLWGETGKHLNNTYISIDDGGAAYSEYTAVANFWMNRWDNQIDSATRRWAVEEFQYRNGTMNQEDGILFFWQDRIKGWENQRFRFTTSAYPKKYSDLYQAQVSNGAQPGSFGYYDSLYVDDSWHRVLICAESTWAKCQQPEIVIPTEWSDSRITVALRQGSLKEKGKFYFYVVNARGEVNSKGFGACPKCPAPPMTN